MILVVGATSSMGRIVVPQLLENGEKVRAMTRTPEKAEDLKNLGAEVIKGDLREAETIASACRGAEKVIAMSHSFAGKGNSSPQIVDDKGNRDLIDAAKAEGVKYFIFTSVLGTRPDHPVDFIRIKYKIEQYLQNSGLDYTIIRASAFMEFWAAMVGQPIIDTGKTKIFGGGKNPINFVSAEDVAKFALLALESPQAKNRIIEVGGPENLSFEEVVKTFERVAGKTAKVAHIPLPAIRIMRGIVGAFNPALNRMTTAAIYNDTADLTFDMKDTLNQFPLELTKLEDVVRKHITSNQG